MSSLTIGLAALLAATLVARDMVRVPAGAYRPLYGAAGAPALRVAAFRLDRDPVTRGDFLAFVRAHPEWRRSLVRQDLADRRGYLAEWRGDLDPSPRQGGSATDLRRPVTGVSWHAARAYCAANGKRLPTLAEWEYAAAASATARDASRDPRATQRLLALYAGRPRPLPPVDEAGEAGRPNAYGLRGLHGLAWEWVEDLPSLRSGQAGGHASAKARGGSGHDHDHARSGGDSAGGHDLSCAGAAVGAADPANYPAFLRYAIRAGATPRTALDALGFRCAA